MLLEQELILRRSMAAADWNFVCCICTLRFLPDLGDSRIPYASARGCGETINAAFLSQQLTLSSGHVFCGGCLSAYLRVPAEQRNACPMCLGYDYETGDIQGITNEVLDIDRKVGLTFTRQDAIQLFPELSEGVGDQNIMEAVAGYVRDLSDNLE